MRRDFRHLAQMVFAGLPIAIPAMLPAQSITISPGYTTIGVNQTVQYTKSTSGLSPETVTWNVHNIPGGNSTYGTITPAGLYTAPATIPADSITVSALGSDKKTLGIVYVNVAPPGPSVTSVSPNPIPTGNFTVTLTGTGFQPGAIVRFGAANMTTTYVNATTLKTGYWQGSVTPAAVFQVMNPGTLWGAPITIPFVLSGPPPPQAIAPASANVNLGATQQFTSVNASGWTATAGTVDGNGLYGCGYPEQSQCAVDRPRHRDSESGRDAAVYVRWRHHMDRSQWNGYIRRSLYGAGFVPRLRNRYRNGDRS